MVGINVKGIDNRLVLSHGANVLLDCVWKTTGEAKGKTNVTSNFPSCD